MCKACNNVIKRATFNKDYTLYGVGDSFVGDPCSSVCIQRTLQLTPGLKNCMSVVNTNVHNVGFQIRRKTLILFRIHWKVHLNFPLHAANHFTTPLCVCISIRYLIMLVCFALNIFMYKNYFFSREGVQGAF